MESQTLDALRQEVRRLEEEQKKLREQIQTVPNGAAPPPETHPAPPKEEARPAPAPPKASQKQRARGFAKRHRRGLWIAAILALILAVCGYFLWSYLNSYESTDDAFIDGNLDPIGARISGTVIGVYAQNDQFVKKGQVLVDLDPQDYQVEVEQARAAYNQALAQVNAAHPSVPITTTTTQTLVSTSQASVIAAQAAVDAAQQDYEARQADVRQAEAQNINAQANLERYRTLVARDEISRQQYDAAVATAASDAAAVQAARAAEAASLRVLDQRRAQLEQARTQLAEAQTNAPRQISVQRYDVATRLANAAAAKAQLDRVQLNLSYTKIVAPVDGVVMSRTAEVGQHVQPGQDLLSISEIENVWVTANFKETQLARMRPGQPVEIHVDAFDRNYQGYVADMPGASGAATSLLPPENATGNFVKVVQRLPVRILFKPGQNDDHRLRIGMSCEPKVWLNGK
ncbi:MAG TPA: HlyD family secretion protein [Bryobacteraceae bacterium]|jgi:membrane fusion protein (multidrug efflux system)|nr:HlyD family secretion protein [Bryobacteraceae bacterium]